MSISRVSSLLAITLFSVAVSACGSEGPMGAMGEMGDPGTKGDKGDMGDPGTPGGMGTPGEDGEDGTSGSNGSNGSNGLACWDLNANGTCDVGTEDRSGDSACTAVDCQGPAGPAGPAGATAGQGAGSVFGSAAVPVAPTTPSTPLPGLAINVVVPATGSYVAFISSDGSASIPSTEDPGTAAIVSVFLRVDGNLPPSGGFQNLVLLTDGTGFDKWSFSMATPLTAGTHTVTVNTIGNAASTADAVVSGPVDNGLQGALTVLLLKL